MGLVKWFERKFEFNNPQNTLPCLMERLAGTPARLEEKIKNIEPAFLAVKFDNTWSIKENIGHLTDLEPLWQGRLDDFIMGNTELRAADLSNNKTNEANHNNTPVELLLAQFRQVRGRTLHMLENVNEDIVFKTALHPRLKTPMRLIDSFLFVAEHDDHHLARITELCKLLRQQQ
jgi:hypothetical protein